MPVHARHTNELLLRLERVADIGCAEVTNNELQVWYAQKRFTVGIWRDIAQRWEELLESHVLIEGEQKNSPLFIGAYNGGWVFVWGEGLTTSPESWLKDVRELAKVKSAGDAGSKEKAST